MESRVWYTSSTMLAGVGNALETLPQSIASMARVEASRLLIHGVREPP